MRVAIVADGRRLAEEHSVHARTCVGLLDAGLGVVRLVPDSFDVQRSDPRERPLSLIPRLPFEPKVVPWLRGWRRGRLLDALERSPPDLLLATGVEAWDVALDVGAAIDRPVLVEITSRDEARRVIRHRRDAKEGTLCGCIVRSAPLGESIRAALGPMVVHVPAGVATGRAEQGEAISRGPSRSIVVLSSGGNAEESRACFEGLRRAIDSLPPLPAMMVCVELQGRQSHEVWRALRRLELLPRVSAVADVSELRSLVLACDALLMPERRGEVRSVLLEAMAEGMPIAALRDDDVDALVDGVTARIVQESDPETWASAIDSLLSPEARSAPRSTAAIEHVRRHHRSSDSIDSLERVLRSVVEGDSMPFGPAPSMT